MNLSQEEIIQNIIYGVDSYYYMNLPLNVRSNKKIALAGIVRSPNNFYYSSDDLKNNCEFVLDAIKIGRSDVLEYAADHFKDDSEFLLNIIQILDNNYEDINNILEFISDNLKNTPQFFLDILKIRNDIEVLKYVSENLQNDRNFVLLCMKYGYAFENISENLRNDYEIVLEAIRNDGDNLMFASDNLKNNSEIVLEAIQNKFKSICYASDDLKNNPDFILSALEQNSNNLCALYFILNTVKENSLIISHITNFFQNDKKIILEIIKQDCSQLKYTKNDKILILETVKQNGLLLKDVSENFKNDDDIILEAINQNYLALRYVKNPIIFKNFNFNLIEKICIYCKNNINIYTYQDFFTGGILLNENFYNDEISYEDESKWSCNSCFNENKENFKICYCEKGIKQNCKDCSSSFAFNCVSCKIDWIDEYCSECN
jgi:hypothetical protein